jgi:predicted methyltransferase
MNPLVKKLLLAGVFTLTASAALAQDYVVPDNIPAHIKRGIRADERTAEMTARDAARMPAETLAIAGLKEGDHIAEITAFGQYYSSIMAAAVGPEGRIDMYDMPYMERFGATEAGKAFAASHPNTTYTVVHYNDIEFADDLDAVYNILYYHDLQPMEVNTAAMNAKVLAALKPGGTYFIVDHKAEDGSGWRDAGTIHRMAKETIIDEVTAAGFELVEDSDLLANPEDDRKVMVFTEGTRGHTDQAVLVFRKPE